MSNARGLNRRQLLGSLVACAASPLSAALAWPRVTEECLLKNEFVEFRALVRDGKVVSRRLVNKLANETIDLPTADFALEFDTGSVVTPDSLSVIDVTRADERFELVYSRAEGTPAPLQVRVEYHLPRHGGYLRKQIALRTAKESSNGRLMRADLDSWMGVKRPWESMKADRLRFGSHPIFCDTFWAGVEFVAAFNEYSDEGFVLRSRPGGKVITADWVKLRPTVTGVAEPNAARESFLRYIEDVRLRPARLVACYNSWWSLPEIFHEKEFVDLTEQLKERLFEKQGVFFDIVTGDMGWSDPRSIWKIDKANQPDDLNQMVGIVESAQGKPGLWMSPSEVYAPVIDYDWAKKNDYTVVPEHRGGRRPYSGISLADPRYRSETKQSLQWLIKEKRLGHIKYDGFIAREEDAHHGLLPGDDSVEPLAEYSLELIAASREANPDLVTEPTYLNSHANYISPWIIQHADFVWGNAGGDCPLGVGPAPDYREAHTTAREYFIFTSLREVWLPQNALQYFDIVHCDEAGGFPNHAAMAFGRGRFFVSTYINPKFMTGGDWQIYAGLLKWARHNREVLQNTAILTSRVELGEPYAYAHWSGFRGIIAVRNPSNESQKFTLDMAKAAAPQGLSNGVCYTQYPYRKGIQEGVSSTSTIALDLAPWELVFLEIVPRPQLAEPVAMGARWNRDSNGNMKVSSEGSSSIHILLPQGGEQVVASKPLASGDLRGEVLAQKIDRLPQAKWLRQADKPLPTASFELESEISIPEGAPKGKALLLLEFPGKDHLPTSCSCLVNGRAAALQESSSAGHIGYNAVTPENPWRDLLPYISHWTWYICELESGSTRVKFSGVFPYESCKMGLWTWADWDLTQQSAPVSIECPEPAMPQHQAHLKRRGICVLAPAIPPEPPPSDGRWRNT
jgi:hypothetical protein